MVDPNRKINRLTEKDIEFLEECEQEFSMRYTEDDAEYMEYCSKPFPDPPLIENWNSGDFPRNEGGGRHHNRYQRNWRSFGGSRNRGRYDDFKSGPLYSHRRPFYERPNCSKPMVVRRDYSNFVAASKDN